MGERLAAKVAIVTGGNSGIGAATAKLFAAEGAKVVLMARRVAEGHAVEAAIREPGGEARFIRCDVTDRASIEAAVKETVDVYGAIHVLFNNAGTPGDVARAVLFPACDESGFINGQVLNIDGGAAGKV